MRHATFRVGTTIAVVYAKSQHIITEWAGTLIYSQYTTQLGTFPALLQHMSPLWVYTVMKGIYSDEYRDWHMH